MKGKKTHAKRVKENQKTIETGFRIHKDKNQKKKGSKKGL